MPDSRVCVLVYSTDDQAGTAGEPPPFTALEWPAQSVAVGDIASREAAPAAFIPVYNDGRGTQLAEDDFRFFGPLWATANVRQLDGSDDDAGEWEAAATADKLYRVTAPTEAEVKAAWVEYFYTEYTKALPDAFPRPLEETNVDWTYNPDG